jgi:hypothetical protein
VAARHGQQAGRLVDHDQVRVEVDGGHASRSGHGVGAARPSRRRLRHVTLDRAPRRAHIGDSRNPNQEAAMMTHPHPLVPLSSAAAA